MSLLVQCSFAAFSGSCTPAPGPLTLTIYICSKARRILGIVYRRFYGHSDVATLHQLYVSLVRSYLEYAAPVWSPYLQKDIAMLEKTQQFASRICTKNWDAGYQELLDMLDLPSLAQRRLHTRLRYVYKIVHRLLYFHADVVVPRSALHRSPSRDAILGSINRNPGMHRSPSRDALIAIARWREPCKRSL